MVTLQPNTRWQQTASSLLTVTHECGNSCFGIVAPSTRGRMNADTAQNQRTCYNAVYRRRRLSPASVTPLLNVRTQKYPSSSSKPGVPKQTFPEWPKRRISLKTCTMCSWRSFEVCRQLRAVTFLMALQLGSSEKARQSLCCVIKFSYSTRWQDSLRCNLSRVWITQFQQESFPPPASYISLLRHIKVSEWVG